MQPKRFLVFGGTSEARLLADRLVDEGFGVVTALAGVTKAPMLPKGEVHRGRFGGVDGIIAYANEMGFDAIIDATHPFAAKISKNIAEAEKRLARPSFRLEREAWRPQAGDEWIEVPSIETAARAVPQTARVFLTLGQRGLEPFLARSDLSGVIRVIEPIEQSLPAPWRSVQQRPPYLLAEERSLFENERFTILVTKNSGGAATTAKLIAARERKIPVVMIARPDKPAMRSFSNVATLVEALKA
ncbi:MAG: cobalt-precorrin-6A reductase [Rhizobiales bacterium]|nr:cobalt-precorrin-6A reductase [Hyphomicrobiales bacterium]